MTQIKQPSRQQVRDYKDRRVAERRPPPDPKVIRRELGWELIEMARKPY